MGHRSAVGAREISLRAVLRQQTVVPDALSHGDQALLYARDGRRTNGGGGGLARAACRRCVRRRRAVGRNHRGECTRRAVRRAEGEDEAKGLTLGRGGEWPKHEGAGLVSRLEEVWVYTSRGLGPGLGACDRTFHRGSKYSRYYPCSACSWELFALELCLLLKYEIPKLARNSQNRNLLLLEEKGGLVLVLADCAILSESKQIMEGNVLNQSFCNSIVNETIELEFVYPLSRTYPNSGRTGL